MADIIPIRKVQPDDFPREMIGRFYDWLDFDNIFTMKALVRIISCDFYDLSKDRFELEGSISLDVGFEVQAEALAMVPIEGTQPMSLYFHTMEGEESEQMSKQWQVGGCVIVKGEYSFLVDDYPPSFTLFVKSVEDVMPVPEEFLPVVRSWLKNRD
jgi:hypothetical protein